MPARSEFATEVTDDFERIRDHLVQHGVDDAASRIDDIIAAIGALERNPLIGRPAGPANRELLVGRRSRGCLALYRHVTEIDLDFVLAVRSQSEAAYVNR